MMSRLPFETRLTPQRSCRTALLAASVVSLIGFFSQIFPATATAESSFNVNKVSQLIGGLSRKVAISGNRAYVTANSMLSIYDISDPSKPSFLGYYDTPGMIYDLAVSGDLVYVAAGGDGLRIINVSNLEAPFEVGFLSQPDIAIVSDVAVLGSYAFVSSMMGSTVVDVSDPTAPVAIGNGWASNNAIYITGNKAYITGLGGELLIYDISSPAAPVALGSYHYGNNGSGINAYQEIYVSGSYAYIAACQVGLVILDVSDPNSPSEVYKGQSGMSGCASDIQVVETTAYVASEYFFAFDVSDPASPVSLGRNDDRYVYGFEVSGGLAYLGAGSHFSVVNVSNPAGILEVGRYEIPAAKTIDKQGDFIYLSQFAPGANVEIIDVSDPALPRHTGKYQNFIPENYDFMRQETFDAKVLGDNAYIACCDGFYVVDIRSKSAPSLASFLQSSVYTLDVAPNYLWGAVNSGLQGIDVSNPSAPVSTGFYARTFSGIDVVGTLAYLASGYPVNGLSIMDISDPLDPIEIGRLDTPGGMKDVAVAGDYAYMLGASSGLHIMNVSIASVPVEIGSFDTDGEALRLFVYNNYAYIADGKSGLRVIDVSTPSSPSEVGYYITPGSVSDVYVSGNYAYVVDSLAGLFILDFPDDNDALPPSVIDNQGDDDTWRSTDPGAIFDVDFSDAGGSHLDRAQFTVWSAPGMAAGTGTEILSWTDIAVAIDLDLYTDNWGVAFASLSEGFNYVSVRAYDNAGNISDVATDVFYVKKDTTPPLDVTPPSDIVTVNDGMGADIDTVAFTTALSANWSESSDDESGIAAYWYAIGTVAGASDVVDWTSASTTTTITHTGLSLTASQTYYFSVKAENGVGIYSMTSVSDGVTIEQIWTPSSMIINRGWNLVGVSIQNVSVDFDTILGESNYEIFSFNGEYTSLTAATDSIDMELASGYWIYSSVDKGSIESITGDEYTSESKVIELKTGWNMFSNPFNKAIPWADGKATVSCGELPEVYKYNGNGYSKVSPNAGNYLAPWEGYVIKADKSCNMTISK